jgi:hypothetical protein
MSVAKRLFPKKGEKSILLNLEIASSETKKENTKALDRTYSADGAFSLRSNIHPIIIAFRVGLKGINELLSLQYAITEHIKSHTSPWQ